MEDRKAIIDKMARKLKTLDDDIAYFQKKMEAQNAHAKAYKEIEQLKGQRYELQKKMDRLGNSGDEAWEEIKYGLEKGWDELKMAFERARAKF